MYGVLQCIGACGLMCARPHCRPAHFLPSFLQGSLVVTATRLNFTETSAPGVFNVSLGAEPTSAVTVTLALTDSTVASLDRDTITFLPGSFPQPQAVTVTPISNDRVDSGGGRTTLVLLNATSDEAAFNGLTVPPVTVDVADDDTVSGG